MLILSAEDNTISNNNVQSDSWPLYIIGTNDVTGNTITGGVYDASGTDADISLAGTDISTSFRHIDFSTPRRIRFSAVYEWPVEDTIFRYNHQAAGNIWLETYMSSSCAIIRDINTWSQNLIEWEDHRYDGSNALTATYTIKGLSSGDNYDVFDNGDWHYSGIASGGQLEFYLKLEGGNHVIKVERNTGWMSPNNHIGEPNDWNRDTYAYDGYTTENATHTRCNQLGWIYTPFIELRFPSSMTIDEARWYAWYDDDYALCHCRAIDVDYYDGSYHNLYEGAFADRQMHNYGGFGTISGVTGVRIRFETKRWTWPCVTADLFEFQFHET